MVMGIARDIAVFNVGAMMLSNLKDGALENGAKSRD